MIEIYEKKSPILTYSLPATILRERFLSSICMKNAKLLISYPFRPLGLTFSPVMKWKVH